MQIPQIIVGWWWYSRLVAGGLEKDEGLYSNFLRGSQKGFCALVIHPWGQAENGISELPDIFMASHICWHPWQSD
jgi:hypothetical protein